MNFTYVAREPPDGRYGGVHPNGTWMGIIGEVQKRNVEIGKLHKKRLGT